MGRRTMHNVNVNRDAKDAKVNREAEIERTMQNSKANRDAEEERSSTSSTECSTSDDAVTLLDDAIALINNVQVRRRSHLARSQESKQWVAAKSPGVCGDIGDRMRIKLRARQERAKSSSQTCGQSGSKMDGNGGKIIMPIRGGGHLSPRSF